MLRTQSLPLALCASISSLALVAGCGSDGGVAEEAEAEATVGPTVPAFVSRPDLTAPDIEITPAAAAPEADGSLVMLGPKSDGAPLTGVLIVDEAGEPVWIHPTESRSYDVRVQELDGEQVLTWWQGTSPVVGMGIGEFVIVDDSYREIATITTGGDVDPGQADIHEGRLTPDGTALIAAYVKEQVDLTAFGGPEDGWVWDNVVQEVDVDTGEVLFSWRSLDHVPMEATKSELPEDGGTEDAPFDYFHVNSVAEDADGSLLVSARNTWAVYDVDRESGDVLWTLGGEEGDFELGDGVEFAWQHDAERQADGTLTLFDNQSEPDIGPTSRGLRLDLDEQARTATLVTEYLPPDPDRLAGSQGSLEQLANGNVFIGWGSRPFYSEFAADGTLLWDAALGSGDNYRAYRQEWTATPAEPPDAVLADGAVHVSWNGATEVDSWRLVAGDDEVSAEAGQPVPRSSFETRLPVDGDPAYLAVEALDADGRVLGSTVPTD
ncbi:arylsulfotransferase family protein [Modestobacter sp. VKM Ac-2985]|uniref:arylsulfotransferase family protein n=1 Tax=Modestobacter sp. VKM Ac-2985 TaxID=3004139 RepID=UPI0022AB63D4|nr:arylsulfotransferase family protein [Modestobacter sp. VKM Ac-2985]MCZ2837186.1 arylsulfotransferase family protein [Modestobacter sp. VKM Ac-2985]